MTQRVAERLFEDLVEIASGNVAIAAARIMEFGGYSDGIHAAALDCYAAFRRSDAFFRRLW